MFYLIQQRHPSVVAIDLGSNSFHLLEATLGDRGELKPLTTLAYKVQLALDMEEERITPAAIERGLDCLRVFMPYCRQLSPQRVRIVGTQALRRARNQAAFIDAAVELLGHPVGVISGEEEAHLAYLGVACDPEAAGKLLVADIGGGSTELIAGINERVQAVASLQLGCVSWLSFFPGGRITPSAYALAKAAALEALQPIAPRFKGAWRATGCSGTLLAVGDVLRQNGWSDGGINRRGLALLEQALLRFEHIEAVRFQGLLEHRRNIFASGMAIVSAIFEALQLDEMALSAYGLREGVAWSLLQS